MADDLAISLHTGLESSSGSGSAVDLYSDDGVQLRKLGSLQLVVSAVDGVTPSLAVTLETSDDGTVWETVEAFSAQTAVGVERLKTGDFRRYLRVSWVLTGTDPEFTFAVGGTAFSVYCGFETLITSGCGGPKLAAIDQSTRWDQLIAATLTARSLIGKRFTHPILSVDGAVSAATAKLASMELHTSQGINPSPQATALAIEAAAIARKWLREVGQGNTMPAIVDTSPDDRPYATGAVVSETTRGWGSYEVL